MQKLRFLLGVTVLACVTASPTVSALAVEMRDTVTPDTGSIAGTSAEQIFIVGGTVSFECTTLSGSFGSTSFPTSTIRITTPQYSGCKAKVAGVTVTKAVVKNTACDYILSVFGSVTVACKGANTIEATASTCIVKVGSQGPLMALTYSNVATGIQVVANVTGISAPNKCDATPTATYKGTAVIKGATGTLSVS